MVELQWFMPDKHSALCLQMSLAHGLRLSCSAGSGTAKRGKGIGDYHVHFENCAKQIRKNQQSFQQYLTLVCMQILFRIRGTWIPEVRSSLCLIFLDSVLWTNMRPEWVKFKTGRTGVTSFPPQRTNKEQPQWTTVREASQTRTLNSI